MDKKTLANILLCLLIVIAVWVGLEKTSSALTPKGLFVSDHVPSADAARLLDKLELKRYAVLGKAGNAVDGTFLIANHGSEDVRNVRVHCEFFDDAGQYADRQEWVLHDIFKAGSEQEYKSGTRQFINSQAKAVACTLVDLQPLQEPFFTISRASGHGHRTHAPASGGHGH